MFAGVAEDLDDRVGGAVDDFRLLREAGDGVDEARQLLLVKGAVPGAKGGFVTVRPAVKVKVKKGAN
mgnify:CR=1 FL=1